MSDDDLSLHDLAPLYALDALDGDELAAFEAHLPGCATCQGEVAGFHDTAAELGHIVDREPPPELRAELLDQLGSTPQLPPLADDAPPVSPAAAATGAAEAEPSPTPAVGDLDAARARRDAGRSAGRGGGRTILVAAAAALVVAVGIGAALLGRDASSPADDYAALLDAPDAVLVELAGADGAPGAVTVAWSPEQDRVGVSAVDLDDPPEGLTYALWLLPAEGAPVAAALFTPDGGAVSTVASVADRDSAGWGITLEPIGGSDEPTLPILYSGTL